MKRSWLDSDLCFTCTTSNKAIRNGINFAAPYRKIANSLTNPLFFSFWYLMRRNKSHFLTENWIHYYFLRTAYYTVKWLDLNKQTEICRLLNKSKLRRTTHNINVHQFWRAFKNISDVSNRHTARKTIHQLSNCCKNNNQLPTALFIASASACVSVIVWPTQKLVSLSLFLNFLFFSYFNHFEPLSFIFSCELIY